MSEPISSCYRLKSPVLVIREQVDGRPAQPAILPAGAVIVVAAGALAGFFDDPTALLDVHCSGAAFCIRGRDLLESGQPLDGAGGLTR